MGGRGWEDRRAGGVPRGHRAWQCGGGVTWGGRARPRGLGDGEASAASPRPAGDRERFPPDVPRDPSSLHRAPTARAVSSRLPTHLRPSPPCTPSSLPRPSLPGRAEPRSTSSPPTVARVSRSGLGWRSRCASYSAPSPPVCPPRSSVLRSAKLAGASEAVLGCAGLPLSSGPDCLQSPAPCGHPRPVPSAPVGRCPPSPLSCRRWRRGQGRRQVRGLCGRQDREAGAAERGWEPWAPPPPLGLRAPHV